MRSAMARGCGETRPGPGLQHPAGAALRAAQQPDADGRRSSPGRGRLLTVLLPWTAGRRRQAG